MYPFLNVLIDLQLLDADPRWMSAVSSGARVSWGEMVCEEFSDHFHLGPDKPEPDQRIFLVTLCDRRCCTSHQEKEIDIPGFIRRLRRGLRGLSYLGMIEPAYYVNVCEGTHSWQAAGVMALASDRLGNFSQGDEKTHRAAQSRAYLAADCRWSRCRPPKMHFQGQIGEQSLLHPESSQEGLSPL